MMNSFAIESLKDIEKASKTVLFYHSKHFKKLNNDILKMCAKHYEATGGVEHQPPDLAMDICRMADKFNLKVIDYNQGMKMFRRMM